MKLKQILVVVVALLLGAAVYSAADARPSSGNTTWPVSLIGAPCGAVSYQYPLGGPARLSCKALGLPDRSANVTIPAPWLEDRAPEMSLVGIPTFFTLSWDPSSRGAQDSAPLTMSYPVGDPTDKLINVRVQLRLRALDATGSSSETTMIDGNFKLETPDNLFLYKSTELGEVEGGEFASMICVAGYGSNQNALLKVDPSMGGYSSAGACQAIADDLEEPSTDNFFNKPIGYQDTKRYIDWRMLSPNYFVAFSPYASNHGSGTDLGSPAFRLTATSRFAVEARVVWDRHEHKVLIPTTDCQWSYSDNYDFINWGNWPDPIFCRNEVIVDWQVFCTPFTGGCVYGKPDDWWQTVIPVFQAEAIRRPDGSYGTSYDFVSVQSQSLLSSP